MASQPLAKVVGRRIGIIRSKRKVDQARLIAELNEFGLEFTQPTISRIERGERELNATELFCFAAALGCSVVALFDPDDDVVEVAGGVLEGAAVRDWVRGFVPPPGMPSPPYYEAAPEDEWRAFFVPGFQRLVRNVTDRLPRALGDENTDTELVLRLLDN